MPDEISKFWFEELERSATAGEIDQFSRNLYRDRAGSFRFGRYPHLNAVLGRASTEEELAFLEEPGSSF